jgi:hypothetical protein
VYGLQDMKYQLDRDVSAGAKHGAIAEKADVQGYVQVSR